MFTLIFINIFGITKLIIYMLTQLIFQCITCNSGYNSFKYDTIFPIPGEIRKLFLCTLRAC